MKRISVLVVALTLLSTLSLQPARAELCTIDAVPAATLLLPYFEVDLSKFPRLNKVEQTVISLQNASAAPALAHVILWTDLSVPTLAFDVFLTGYDVENINLTELFYTGQIRGLQTGQATPGFVLGDTPAGGIQTVGSLIQAHRGDSVDGQCYGTPNSRNIARGYVTIDNVNEPSILFPNESGYFGSGGLVNDNNALWGVVYVSYGKSIQSDLLVHIEAGSFGSGDYTFYGRYVGFNGSDNREPLGTQWGARYFTGKEPTDVIVWRDSTADQGPFSCSALGQSGWYPLGHAQIVAFNETEDAIELAFDPDQGPIEAFPAETQKLTVGRGVLDVSPFKAGWLYMNLRHTQNNTGQSYVWVRQGLRKRASLHPGLPLYDQDSGDPSDASACGSAPSSNRPAIQ